MEDMIFKIYNEAIGFLQASGYLANILSKNGTNLLTCSSAYTVNYVFACELLLKALCKIYQIKSGKTHRLVKLFLLLPAEIKITINDEYKSLYKEQFMRKNELTLRDLEACIEAYDNAFVEWRYCYEGFKKQLCLPWIDFKIFVFILKRMVEKYLDLEIE